MQHTPFANLRRTAWPAALIATGLLTACGGADSAAEAAVPAGQDAAGAAVSPPQTADATATAYFEGTMQQVVISLGPDAIRAVAGSNELQTVLALSPDRVVEAVHNGEIDADSIQKATLEIDGRMGRLQTEGESSYTILDGRQVAAHMVDPGSRMIMTMDPGKLAAAAAARGESTAPRELDVEKVGEREIRGFDAVGHRFEFFGDNIATVWLSEELESKTGPIFDIWYDVNPLGQMEVGDGAPVRIVVVSPETLASGGGYMPAYTITEFYDLQPGAVADERFAMPEGYQQRGMAELGRGAP